MNRNRIITDGWSNPDSGLMFRGNWPGEPEVREHHRLGECCAACPFSVPFSNEWGLCSNRESRHDLETVFCQFACPHYAGEPGVDASAYPRMPAAPITHDSRIGTDLLCTSCGYNLRTLSLDGKCPECGQAVRRSVERDEFVIESAAAYQKLGAGGLAAIVAALRGTDPLLRNAAIYALIQLGDAGRETLPELIGALGDPEADVRWWAAYALGELGPVAQGAAEALTKAAADADPEVRAAARAALKRVGGKDLAQPEDRPAEQSAGNYSNSSSD